MGPGQPVWEAWCVCASGREMRSHSRCAPGRTCARGGPAVQDSLMAVTLK